MSPTKLEYNQIRLRALEPEDLDVLFAWENDLEIWELSNTITPFSKYILTQYIQESHRDIYEIKQLRLIIETLTGEPVGAIDLFDFDPFNQRAGVGILIHKQENRQQGFATDSLTLLCSYAENTLGLRQLYANISSDNTASISLFEKCGFIHCGTKKEWLRSGKTWKDELIFQKIF